MRSKVADRMMAKMPMETQIFARKYADLVVLINQILKEKECTQKELASSLNKTQSEISKWLNGNHNFTLRSICKLEAELKETLLEVPHRPGTFAFKGKFTRCVFVTISSEVNLSPKGKHQQFDWTKISSFPKIQSENAA